MHARFYHPEKIAIGQSIALSDENKHHAARVLRLKVGDAVTLFTGEGGEYPDRRENPEVGEGRDRVEDVGQEAHGRRGHVERSPRSAEI